MSGSGSRVAVENSEFDDGITAEERKQAEAVLEGLLSELPSASWKVPFTYNCKVQCGPFWFPRLSQVMDLAPTGIRLFTFLLRKRLMEGRKPFIDVAGMLPHKPIYGVPLGGIGSGSIGRGYRGEFCRFHLVPGDYSHSVVETNQFIVTVRRGARVVYNQVLSVQSLPPRQYAGLSEWRFAFPAKDAAYVALYPRSWTVYKIHELKLRLICRQVSPVLPHNYSESCLPTSVFVWTVESYEDSSEDKDKGGKEPLEVSITFVFKNGVGQQNVDCSGTVRNRPFSKPLGPVSARLPPSGNHSVAEQRDAGGENRGHETEERVEGVVIEQQLEGMPCTLVLGSRSVRPVATGNSRPVDVSVCAAFDPHASASASRRSRLASYLGFGGKKQEGLTKSASISSMSSGAQNGGSISESASQPHSLNLHASKPKPELSNATLNTGSAFWQCLDNFGRLLRVEEQTGGATQSIETQKRDVCAATCATCTVRPGERCNLEFVLVWHMPNAHFKARQRQYKRRYTRWFSSESSGAVDLAVYAMQHYADWEKDIEDWQAPVLNDAALPDWYKYALFNETYFVSDGGTVWLERHPDELKADSEAAFRDSTYACETLREIGHFAYLEGHEYRMFNTYDVHFYASYALIEHWPSIQLSIQLDVARHAISGDQDLVRFVFTGQRCSRLVKNTVPHDVGDPEDEPFQRVNGYGMSPSAEWKDLGSNFILLTYRDAVLMKDAEASRRYLRTVYPIARTVFESGMRFDTDSDGLPDHSDLPDSTFDAWLLRGACVYTSVFWITAIFALIRMATRLLRDAKEKKAASNESASAIEKEIEEWQSDIDRFTALLSTTTRSFEAQFWNENGGFYQFASNRQHSNLRRAQVVMAAALTGYWCLQTCVEVDCGAEAQSLLEGVLPSDHVDRCLRAIYRSNCCLVEKGRFGAINGAYADGAVDTSSMQSEEVWTGVVYSLASSMIYSGMTDEAMRTAHGCFTACLRMGLQFQTPEAIMLNYRFRSLGYMRPLSIWSMQLAIEHRKRNGRGVSSLRSTSTALSSGESSN